MVSALSKGAMGNIPHEQAREEALDFGYGPRWDDAYPWKTQEYQRHNPSELSGLFGLPQQQLMQMAGEVKPMYPTGMEPANAGKRSMEATDYAWGNKMSPNVQSIGTQTMQDWLTRQRLKVLEPR